MNEDRS